MTEELKPCPFCPPAVVEEYPASIEHMGGHVNVWARCCDFYGPLHDSEEQAVAAWNRRATPAPAQPEGQEDEPVAWISESELFGKRLRWSRLEALAGGATATPLHLHPPKPGAAAPAEGAAWQPIETAPKGGRTLLLGAFNSHSKWRTMRGQWVTQEDIDTYWDDPEFAEPGWHETAVESETCWGIDPTHWMPLPAAPKEKP